MMKSEFISFKTDLVDSITEIQDKLTTYLSNSREKSLCITKLDEARLWLNEIAYNEIEFKDEL